MVLRLMQRVEVLFLVSGMTIMVIVYLPSFMTHSYTHMPFKIPQNIINAKQRSFIKSFDGTREDELKPFDLFGALIVHGIRKPHLPKHPLYWQHLNFFQKLIRPAPFSPGNQALMTSNNQSSTDSPESSHPNVSLSTSSASQSTEKPRIHLVKELYEGGHVWSHPELCGKSGSALVDVSLLVLVTSSARNKDARAAIRLTWGRLVRQNVVVAFVLPQPSLYMIDQLIEEDAANKDLIVSKIRDSPLNATLHTISLLEWVDTHCPHAHLVLKTNDHVFINIPKLMKSVFAPQDFYIKSIWGQVIQGEPPTTLLQSPLQSPSEHSKTMFPEHVSGSAFLFTPYTARLLLQAAPDLPHSHREDVFVTGVLADAAGVHRVHVEEFFRYNGTRNLLPCAARKDIAIDNVTYEDMFELWYRMHIKTEMCGDTIRDKKKKKKFVKDINVRKFKNSTNE